MRMTVVCPSCGREVPAGRAGATIVRPHGHLTTDLAVCVRRPVVRVELLVSAMPSDRIVLATLTRLLGRELSQPFVYATELFADYLADRDPQLIVMAEKEAERTVRRHHAVGDTTVGPVVVQSMTIRVAELVKTDSATDPDSFILGPRDAYTGAVIAWWEKPA